MHAGVAPRISLVPGHQVEAWNDPEIEAYFRNSYLLMTPPPTSLSMEAQNPESMRTWCRFWFNTFHRGIVDHRLMEMLRVQIAVDGNCEYWATHRSASARRDGLSEEALISAVGQESQTLTNREEIALQFVRRLSNAWQELDAADLALLRSVFTEPELVEIVAFGAWQYGGPRTLSSWGAEGYKTNGQVVLSALPVRLAYAEYAERGEAAPALPDPPQTPAAEILARASRRNSPPAPWLEFLAPHPTLLSTWSGLYDQVVEGGIVEARTKQLMRVMMAERLDCPEWAPPDSQSVVEAGIGPKERQALLTFDLAPFTPRERAALGYTESLISVGQVEDEVFAQLHATFTEGEIIELGFAIAVQNGVVRVYRALAGTGR